jgi:molybdate transport system substrate-binding protein
MGIRRVLAPVLLFMTVVSGCSRRPDATVYCGAGLQPPVEELIKAFEKEKGVRIEARFSGSGILLSQVETTHLGDVYLPGDQFFMQQAVDKGFITGQAVAAVFIPVIAVQKGNPKGVKGLEDLVREDLRVGLGEARTCAVGRSSAAMLRKAGILDQVKPVQTSSTVIELENNVKMKVLDAAIVWDAVARFHPDEVDMIPIGEEYLEVVTVPVGVLKFSENPELAEAFMEFVSGPKGREVFVKHGYSVEQPAEGEDAR